MSCTAEDCGDAVLARDRCSRHYQRDRRAGRLPVLPTNEEEYESRVDRSAGVGACHPWTRSTVEGYGQFQRDGENLATRWGYKRYVGPLGDDEFVRHTCDNPPCQNRTHWIKGSPLDNSRDMVARGRSLRGERNVNATITTETVAAIRAAYTGAYGQTAVLAKEYGLNRKHVWRIVTNRRWA